SALVRPTGLMVATDRWAVGLVGRLAAAGVTVPDDIAVAAYDNIEGAPYASPPLTTVDQPFDEVGALAASLALAQASGAHVPAVPHVAPGRFVVRGSCGCAATAGPPVADRSQTARRLVRMLSTGNRTRDAGLTAEVEKLVAEVEALAEAPLTAYEIEGLTRSVRTVAPRPAAVRSLARVLVEHLAATTPQGAGSSVSATLRNLQAEAFLARATAVERKLAEQFGLDAGLLGAVGSDPRDLSWLAGTHISGGVLALWDDDHHESLTVVGSHDPAGVLGDLVGTTTTVTQFPPPSLVATSDPADRTMCFVVPVRTREKAWGLLAVVAEIDTDSAQETFHHWAALLASALDQSDLQRKVHTSERRYALAAKAANDGLWEVELAGDTVHLSDRCRDLLGQPQDPAGVEAFTALAHPDDRDALQDAVSTAMSLRGAPVELEYRVRQGDGSYRWVLTRFLGEGPDDGPVERLVGSLADIHTRKELEEQLRQGALYDPVTGLPNRRLFLDRLGLAVARRTRRPDARFAVLFLDLDGFKLVNDSLGHLVGDDLLCEIARRLTVELREVDTAARFGGDEFAILLSDPAPEEVLVIAERIQERVAAPIVLGDHEVSVSASIGITTSELEYVDAEDVLRDSDTAMYHAKGTERGTASVFDPEMHTAASGRLRLHSDLRAALVERQFVVHYQPIVALDGSALAHFEALVRWEHPSRGLLGPGAFLPDMVDSSTIVELGRWLIDEVCRQVAVWRSKYAGPVTVSVNLSHREFWAPDLVQTVTRALAEHEVPAESLVLEITETVIMRDEGAALRVMEALHATGVRLHIDDFGTGQSSLSALRALPVDALKIDGSFVRELTETDRTADLVEVILYLGRVLGLEVIAEQVETLAQAERLTTMGCANAQGWLYAKALPAAEAGALLGSPLALAPQLEAEDVDDRVRAH
ncbi:EAL domain-containing protein, partial [Actinotalea sp. C106]|uniref:EAL domain-containing protein n=1 Tax=Actinotalea sp. C106 TaxID=2908644 RepID=UPI002541157D